MAHTCFVDLHMLAGQVDAFVAEECELMPGLPLPYTMSRLRINAFQVYALCSRHSRDQEAGAYFTVDFICRQPF
jgi:hypothetical protein